jgi:hypothetical protein
VFRPHCPPPRRLAYDAVEVKGEVLAKCLMGRDPFTGTSLVVELHGRHHNRPTELLGPETS